MSCEAELQVWPTNIEGESQAGLSVQGGPDMAIHIYPVDNRVWWRESHGFEAGRP